MAFCKNAALAWEGLCHLGAASENIREDFRRDAATVVIETGLAVMEGVEPEVAVTVAAVEGAEKIAHSPPGQISYRALALEFAESVFSSVSAAMHAATSAFIDLEKAGAEWETGHPQPLRAAAAPARRYHL